MASCLCLEKVEGWPPEEESQSVEVQSQHEREQALKPRIFIVMLR